MFSVASPRFAIVREGYEGADEALRAEAERYSDATLSSETQANAARNFEGSGTHSQRPHLRSQDTRGYRGETYVVVAGERIASIQQVGSNLTEGETVIDGAGGTLVPGMYEMHQPVDSCAGNALMNIVAGITSVRDMGNENVLFWTG